MLRPLRMSKYFELDHLLDVLESASKTQHLLNPLAKPVNVSLCIFRSMEIIEDVSYYGQTLKFVYIAL